MVREFTLPDVGEGLTEAEIVSWLVESGDAVSEDQPVAEVETDKAVVEVPSPVNGTVRELHAAEGEVVPVGDVIISFDTDEDEDAGAAATDTTGGADDETVESAVSAVAETDEAPAEHVFASPSARRLARELDIDILAVEGSGPGGRVTDRDVRSHAEGDASDESESEPESAVQSATTAVGDEVDELELGGGASTVTEGEADRDRTLAAPATRRLAEEEGVDIDAVSTEQTRDGEAFVTPEQVREHAAGGVEQAPTSAEVETGEAGEAPAGGVDLDPLPDAEVQRRETREPYTGVRQTIGEAMEESKYTAPHVTHHDEADVTRLVETRGRLKAEAAERGASLSYMPFVVKAVVAALKQYPILNSQLDEEAGEIRKKHYYNVGIAAATDAGLMVPVVTDADRKGMLDIADEMNDLVEKARDRSIAPEEMQGGTFSITNFGAVGGEHATPIINYPETAILGLGEIKEKPRVVDGEVVPRHVLTLSLSIDHRVIDGAEAGQFTNTVKRYLEEPELLLLE
jgi:pyruvate dehydrogenase E2 component (dihydrolipoamide acetyltransferase)